MKIFSRNRTLIGFAAALALIAPQISSAAPPSSIASGTPDSASRGAEFNPPGSDLTRRMDQLNAELDSVFADTFRNFGHWFADSNLISSIDLREQKNDYVVRVYVPAESSKVNAKVENGLLHVTAEAGEKENGNSATQRYEQIISLPGPVQSDKMRIERKKNLVVINLPKTGASIAAASQGKDRSQSEESNDLAALDQKVVERMARMQSRMEKMFRNAFPQDLTSGFQSLRLGSAVNLEEKPDRYVAHFYLPNNDLKNVKVKLENGQLRLTASENDREEGNGRTEMQSGRYEQVLTLPRPVKEKGMKVEREKGTIVVTLPKA
jgi:HSP20 family molecular chaperone IbpA